MTYRHPPAARFRFVSSARGRIMPGGLSMRSPYGLQIIESCVTCPHKEDRLFCNLRSGGPSTPFGNYRIGHLSQGRDAVCRRTAFPRRVHSLHRPREAFHIFRGRQDADPAHFRAGRSAGIAGHDFRPPVRSHRGCHRAHAGQFHQPHRFSEFPARSWRSGAARGAGTQRNVPVRVCGNAHDRPLAFRRRKAGALSSGLERESPAGKWSPSNSI